LYNNVVGHDILTQEELPLDRGELLQVNLLLCRLKTVRQLAAGVDAGSKLPQAADFH
jgi:hypothetical protein